MFPKVMGLVERGWNAHPDWETLSGVAEQQAFDRDLALFYEKISVKEMPCWSRMGVNFRLPHPGLFVRDGLLYANTPIEGAQIRYTTDGTEPTIDSMLWEAPITCQPAVVKAKPNLTNFNKLAPNITGIAKKKVNSAATVRLTPINKAPTIVAPERDVPGNTAAIN